MSDVTNTAVNDLRHELKAWEKSFAAANGGRKAGREDIKKDATISFKYKEYDRLTRKTLNTASTPRKKVKSDRGNHESQVLKDLPANIISATPKRRSRSEKDSQPLEVPAILEEGPTPAVIRCALGPTPQKDGAILGIFDILSATTPSKVGDTSTIASNAVVEATPSKTAVMPSSEAKQSKTPQSSAKRNFLEAFAATPLKRKREDETGYTPSTAKRQYATPAFLRRGFSLSRIDEENNESAVVAPSFKKRGLVRSLSTIIQGLKKQENERMDEEWDILNEIEAEERGEVVQSKVSKVLVEDSQAAEMPLGPDKGVESDDESDAADPGALDANGKPRKVWKKKGLKRQTRRVIMRPVFQKPKKVTQAAASESEESESDGVAETQLHDKPLQPAKDDNGLDRDENGADSDYKHDSHHSPQPSVERKSKKQTKAEIEAKKRVPPEADITTSKASKVKPQAHANFRKLKIKNKNSKAKGRGGRFGRR